MPPEEHRSGRRSSIAAFVVDHAKTEFDASSDTRDENERAMGQAGAELQREMARKNNRTRERRSSLAVNPTWGGPHVDSPRNASLGSPFRLGAVQESKAYHHAMEEEKVPEWKRKLQEKNTVKMTINGEVREIQLGSMDDQDEEDGRDEHSRRSNPLRRHAAEQSQPHAGILRANTWEAGDHVQDAHGRMGAERDPQMRSSSIGRGVSSGVLDRRVSLDRSLTSEGSAESLGSPRGGGGFGSPKMRNAARKAMIGSSFKGLSGFNDSINGRSTSFSKSKRLQKPPDGDEEEDESMLTIEERQKRKAVLSFLTGLPQHPMRVDSTIASSFLRRRSTIGRSASAVSGRPAKVKNVAQRPLVFRGLANGGQDVKRGKDRNELNMVAACFRRMTSDTDCVFGHGMPMGDATMLAALCSLVRLYPRERFCKEGEVCKELCVVIQGELVGTQKGQQRHPVLPSKSIEELGLISEPHHFASTLSAWDQGHCLIAVLPFDKLNKYFLKDAGVMMRVNEYLKDVAWPREKRIERMLATSDAAMVLQTAWRCRLARNRVMSLRAAHLTFYAVMIQKYWRGVADRKKVVRMRLSPMAVVLQRSWRMHLSRKAVLSRKRVKALAASERHNKAASRITMALRKNQMRMKQATLSARKDLLQKQGLLGRETSETGAHPTQKFSDDDMTALKRWLRKTEARCFNRWKREVKEAKSKAESGVATAKGLMHGVIYTKFRHWYKEMKSSQHVIKPWKAKPGAKVCLSVEGKEFELEQGRRIDGDQGGGILVSPLLSDKTLWKVKWIQSGKFGEYYVGSCGRFHLNVWEEEMSQVPVESLGAQPAYVPGEFNGLQALTVWERAKKHSVDIHPDVGLYIAQQISLGLVNIRAAQNRGEGEKNYFSVSAPFGGHGEIACPPGSEWAVSVTVPERSITKTVMVQMSAIDPHDYSAERLDQGYMVSPMVEVQCFQVSKWGKMYELKIPHRSSACRNLQLHFFPAGRYTSDRIVQNVTFDSDYCTVKLDFCGTFAVLQPDPKVPDVVYGRLELEREWRDTIGKQMTRVFMGSKFSGKVWLVPKGTLRSKCASTFPLVWSTMPKFLIRHDTVLQEVELTLAKRITGCELSSWSGRSVYRGNEIVMGFAGIIQPIIGQDRAPTLPITNTNVAVYDNKGYPVATWDNSYCFRMQICNVELRIDLDVPGDDPNVSYIRAMQGRETLREVRLWTVKCWAPEELRDKDLMWLQNLRFIAKDGSVISVKEEMVEPAAMHVPKVSLKWLADDDERLGVWGGIMDKMELVKVYKHDFEEAKKLRPPVAFDAASPKAVSPRSPIATPFKAAPPPYFGGLDQMASPSRRSAGPLSSPSRFRGGSTAGSQVPKLLLTQVLDAGVPLVPVLPTKPKEPPKGRYPGGELAKKNARDGDPPSTDRPMTHYTRATRARNWYGKGGQAYAPQTARPSFDFSRLSSTESNADQSPEQQQRSNTSFGDEEPQSHREGSGELLARSPLETYTRDQDHHSVAGYGSPKSAAGVDRRMEAATSSPLSGRLSTGGGPPRSLDPSMREDSVMKRGLTHQQNIILGDRAVERQKILAERLISQMPTTAGMTADERRRELRRTIAHPGTYNLLDVTYNGDLKWMPAGDVIKGGTGMRGVGNTFLAGNARPKPAWKGSNTMKKAADSMERAPIMASWGWRGEKLMPGLMKVSSKSNDIGLTGDSGTRLPSLLGTPHVD